MLSSLLERPTSEMPQPGKPKTEFGQWLASIRERHGLSQDDLAEAAGMSQEYISMLERGSRNPSKKSVRLISGALISADTPRDIAANIINGGLLAAGFASDTPEIVYISDPDTVRLVEAYKGADEEGRRLLDAAAAMVTRVESQAAIGGRPLDEDESQVQQEGMARLQEAIEEGKRRR